MDIMQKTAEEEAAAVVKAVEAAKKAQEPAAEAEAKRGQTFADGATAEGPEGIERVASVTVTEAPVAL